MKDVGQITRVMPDKRVEALMKFRKRLADNPKVSVANIFYCNQSIMLFSNRFKRSLTVGVLTLQIVLSLAMRELFPHKRFNKVVTVFQHRMGTGVVIFSVSFI